MDHLEQATNNSEAVQAQIASADGWETYAQIGDVAIFRKQGSVETEIWMKATVKVNCSVMKVCDHLWDITHRSKWDYLFQSEKVAILEDHPIVRLTHIYFDVGMPFASERDAALLEHMRITQLKGVVTFSSVVDPGIPTDKNAVRATVFPSGIVVSSPGGAAAKSSLVTYLLHLDFGGSIPDFFMSRFVSGIFEMLPKVGDVNLHLPPSERGNGESEEAGEGGGGGGGVFDMISSFFGGGEATAATKIESRTSIDGVESAKVPSSSSASENIQTKEAENNKNDDIEKKKEREEAAAAAAKKVEPDQISSSLSSLPSASSSSLPPPTPAAAPTPAAPPPPIPSPPKPITGITGETIGEDMDDEDDLCVYCQRPIEGVKFQLLNDGRSVHDECWADYKAKVMKK